MGIFDKAWNGGQLSPEELAAARALPQRPSGPMPITPVGNGAQSFGAGNPLGGSSFSWGDVPGMVGGGIKSVGSWLAKNPDAILGALAFLEGQKANKRSNELSEAAIAEQQRRQAVSKEAAGKLRSMRRPNQEPVPMDTGNVYASSIRRVGRGA